MKKVSYKKMKELFIKAFNEKNIYKEIDLEGRADFVLIDNSNKVIVDGDELHYNTEEFVLHDKKGLIKDDIHYPFAQFYVSNYELDHIDAYNNFQTDILEMVIDAYKNRRLLTDEQYELNRKISSERWLENHRRKISEGDYSDFKVVK